MAMKSTQQLNGFIFKTYRDFLDLTLGHLAHLLKVETSVDNAQIVRTLTGHAHIIGSYGNNGFTINLMMKESNKNLLSAPDVAMFVSASKTDSCPYETRIHAGYMTAIELALYFTNQFTQDISTIFNES